MPIIIPAASAVARWQAAGIHVLDAARAAVVDDRPQRLLLANFAPSKIDSDLWVARLLSNSPIQVELTLLQAADAPADGISAHLLHFYRGFAEVRDQRFDALVITGQAARAPAQGDGPDALALEDLLAWSATHVGASLFIGWASEMALACLHGVRMRELPLRRAGVSVQRVLAGRDGLLRGHDRAFAALVIRDRELRREDLPAGSGLEALVGADDGSLHLVRHAASRRTFVLDRLDLAGADLTRERRRALAAGEAGRGDAAGTASAGWSAHGQLLIANWLGCDLLGW